VSATIGNVRQQRSPSAAACLSNRQRIGPPRPASPRHSGVAARLGQAWASQQNVGQKADSGKTARRRYRPRWGESPDPSQLSRVAMPPRVDLGQRRTQPMRPERNTAPGQPRAPILAQPLLRTQLAMDSPRVLRVWPRLCMRIRDRPAARETPAENRTSRPGECSWGRKASLLEPIAL